MAAPRPEAPAPRPPEPAPVVRVTNVRRPEPPPSPADSPDERLFPEEGSAEGCASGECLPEAAPPTPRAPVAPTPSAPPGRQGAARDNLAGPSQERWRAAVEAVKAASPRHGTALAHGRLLWLRPGEVGLAYRPQDGFHRVQVSSAAGKALLDKALAEFFGRPTRLVLEDAAAEAAPPSIAEEDATSRAAHERSTEGKVRSHPAVRGVLKLLGGEVEHIQVYEPERPPAAPPAETAEEAS